MFDPQGNDDFFNSDILENTDRIHKLIESRRALMDQQNAADMLKWKVSDQLQREKNSFGPGLARKVAALEYSDPELFKYIRKIEFIQDGIWCPKCNVVKNIGLPRPPTSAQTTSQPSYTTRRAPQNTVTPEASYIAAISSSLKACTQQMNTIKKDFDEKIYVVAAAIEKLNQELSNMQRHHAESKKTSSRPPSDFMTIDSIDEEITADQLLS